MNNVVQLPTKDSQIEKLQKDIELHQIQLRYHMRMIQAGSRKLTELLGLEIDS